MSREVDNLVVDPWSYYTFKGRFSDRANARAWAAPNWITDHQDRRRLQAYILLESYVMNMARAWLNSSASEGDKQDRREYGDPSIIVDQIRASVLGESFGLHVRGAQEPVQDRTEDQSVEPITTPEFEALLLLEEWAEDEHFDMKVVENENQSIKLGDSVMVLGWSSRKNRPVLNVWDPGFYFPVWSDSGSDAEGFTQEFPEKVHIAYEYEVKVNENRTDTFVRRITYELRPRDEEDPNSEVTCFMDDGVWLVSGGKKNDGVYDLAPEEGTYTKADLDLNIDFIPVVYFPNFDPGQYNWSYSCLGPVMQILDDLQATDTDLQAAGAVAGTPPIAVSGAQFSEGEISTYGPSTVYQLGDGTMSTVDTSAGMRVLAEYKNELLERLSINSKVPESMLGRVKPSDVPSGIALWLSFAPHSGMIKEMRRIRQVKYRLLLKMVLRMYANDGEEVDADSITPEMRFGSYLPADRMETIKMVVEAMNASKNPMSLETAVRMLAESGVPIDDVQAEVRLIEKRMVEEALSLVQATGDINAGRRLLGYEDGEEVAQPPAGGQPGVNEPSPEEDESATFFE